MALRIFLFLVLLPGIQIGYAQDKKWTLQDCIDYGVEQSLQMQKQKLQNDNNRLEVRDAALDLIPSVNSFSPSLSYNYGRGIDPETNTYTNMQYKTLGGLGVGGGVTLFAGFSGINRLRMAKVARLQGMESTELSANNIAIQVMTAFFTLVYAEEQIKITLEQLENSNLQLRKIQREYELGRRPKSDLFDIQAQQASIEYQLITCQNNRENAQVSLKHLMNYQEDTDLELSVDSWNEILPVKEQNDLNTIYTRAMQSLPQALIAGYDVRIYKLREYTTKANFAPSFSMNGGISFGNYTSQSDRGFWTQISDKNRIGKYFGFNMSIPIFSGLVRHSNLKRAKNNYQNARITYQQTEQSIYTEIQKAILDLESQVQQYEIARKKEEFSALAYQAGRKKYEQGLITIIEVNTTANNYLQAKYDLLKARLNYVLQKKMVDFYKGVPLQTKVGE